jgi:hypothetical protein
MYPTHNKKPSTRFSSLRKLFSHLSVINTLGLKCLSGMAVYNRIAGNKHDTSNFHFSVTNTLTIRKIVNLVDYISQLSLPLYRHLRIMKNAARYPTNITTTGNSGVSNNTLLKSSAKYVIEALGEGIKQSLNGMDINTEFLTLTARSLVQTSGKTVKQIVTKYSAVGRQLAQKRFHYNNTTLSHS